MSFAGVYFKRRSDAIKDCKGSMVGVIPGGGYKGSIYI